ncbi:MAG: phosphopantetheine-binding protein [Spirochaetota bacterium]|jgi:acyl carrier protein|nr:phosphopantetheine-binding protein [Spirochaetota bacterium]
MQREEIQKIINEAIAKEFELDISLLVPEANFETLGLDSLDAVDMVVVLEMAFRVDIRNNFTMADFTNLESLHNFIERLVRQKENAGE